MNNKESWLPLGYDLPKVSSGNYYKFEEGINKFRILSAPIMGYIYWNTDNKPVRSVDYPEVLRSPKKDGKIKHFWAFVVWDYKDEKVKVLEITQVGIMNAINDLVSDEMWGSPLEYDIAVTRKGEGLETEYGVKSYPHSAAPLGAKDREPVYLKNLFLGEDPFVKPKE